MPCRLNSFWQLLTLVHLSSLFKNPWNSLHLSFVYQFQTQIIWTHPGIMHSNVTATAIDTITLLPLVRVPKTIGITPISLFPGPFASIGTRMCVGIAWSISFPLYYLTTRAAESDGNTWLGHFRRLEKWARKMEALKIFKRELSRWLTFLMIFFWGVVWFSVCNEIGKLEMEFLGFWYNA